MRRILPHGWRLIFVMATLALGCGQSVRVHTMPAEALVRTMRDNVFMDGRASPRTAQLLRRYDLEKKFESEPLIVLGALDRQVRRQPDRELVFALAELSYLTAKKSRRHDREQAMCLYLGAVVYSYFYVFDPAVQPPPNNFDPRFRLACDLYNQSLAECIRLAQKQDIRLDKTLHVEFGNSGIDIEITRHGFLWQPEDFGRFRFADEFAVEGLSNHYHNYGLGVPLICERDSERAPESHGKYYPPEQSFPVTAFLRMSGGICDPTMAARCATLELHDPLRAQSIEVAGRYIPLESDLTTPLGYYLAHSGLDRIAWLGLLRGERVQNRAGLYMLQPYDPGKIPVVFVHGLWSSPMAWMQMFNDLRGDAAIRDRYQFWFFMYPTGNPIPYSASLLRKALDQARQDFDPEGKDHALGEMVLVGHSMGGILAKMMVQESGDHLWSRVAQQPFDSLDMEPQIRDQIRRVFFFEPRPYVRRVVFIATPHQGSEMSNRWIGRLGSSLIELPKTMLETQMQMVSRNPNAFRSSARHLPTSVENLAWESPFMQASAEMPLSPRVAFHSIIGDIQPGPVEQSTDGVVAYASSHFEPVSSEYIVPDGHLCQTHPLTTLEVRRILLENLRDRDARRDVVPAHHNVPTVESAPANGNPDPVAVP